MPKTMFERMSEAASEPMTSTTDKLVATARLAYAWAERKEGSDGSGLMVGCADRLHEAAAALSAAEQEIERVQEELADYMGHRTDGIAGKVWGAQHLFSAFEDKLEDLIGEFEKLGHDSYDQSLEIWGAGPDVRLGEEAQRLIHDAGFGQVYLNHGMPTEQGRWETHYSFYNGGDLELPVRGWRRRYVSDPKATTTRVIAGPKDSGYYEIGFWPEGWGDQKDKPKGYYRIVPDPLEDAALQQEK